MSSKDAQLEDLEEAGVYHHGIRYGNALWGDVWKEVAQGRPQ